MNLSNAIYRVIDIETTGLNKPDPSLHKSTKQKDKIVEVAFQDWQRSSSEDQTWKLLKTESFFVDPLQPIPANASAIHHIIDADVKNQLFLLEAWKEATADIDYPVVYVAHNARFDHAFLVSELTAATSEALIETNVYKWICTKRLAAKAFPDAPFGYSNQVLRYWLNLDVSKEARAHRASGDVEVTSKLLHHIIDLWISKVSGNKHAEHLLSFEAILARCWEAVEQTNCNFGKHKGKPWSDVPTSYLEWILKGYNKGDNWEEDVIHTVKKQLEGR